MPSVRLAPDARDRFLVAGAAWRAVRSGEVEAKQFGLYPDGPLIGEPFIAGNIRLDLAALNRTETLLWDVWSTSASDEPLTAADRELYDEVARETTGEVEFATVRRLFTTNDALRTPKTLTSRAPFSGPSEVTLRG